MRRIAVINHANHSLIVEDINEDILEKKYNGDEQAYIDDNYTFDGEYSWDWVVDAEYYPEGESNPVEIDFDNL